MMVTSILLVSIYNLFAQACYRDMCYLEQTAISSNIPSVHPVQPRPLHHSLTDKSASND